MSFDEGFVEEIRRNPADDNARLILADYLEELGDARGEFIRVQVELAEMPAMEEARRALEQREKELIVEHGERWLEPLRQLGAEGVTTRCFNRGLVERVKVSAENFVLHGAELCRLAPAFHCLQLRNMPGHVPSLVTYQMPDQITRLDVSSQRIGITAEDVARSRYQFQTNYLFSADWIDQLTELNLSFNKLDDAHVAPLELRDFSRLMNLNLGVNKLTAVRIGSLISNAKCNLHENLRSLNLKLNPIGTGQEAVEFGSLHQLRHLDVSSCGLTDEAFELHFSNGNFPSLESLILRGNTLGERTAETLMSSGKFENLEQLDLRNTGIPTTATTGLKEKFSNAMIT
ncbi:MAG: TIGR02996 domain-containing protein [Mariniblastus sp.]